MNVFIMMSTLLLLRLLYLKSILYDAECIVSHRYHETFFVQSQHQPFEV